jgi:cytochrome c-type biogenesis protein CcmH
LWKTLCAALSLAAASAAWSREAAPAADNPALEERTMELAAKLRCLVCQNQTIAESNAGLAVDLKNEIREKLGKGENEQQIVDYMVARYGDFVLYRPPFKAITALLWLGPLILLLAGLAWLYRTLARRRRAAEAPELTDAEQRRARALLEGNTESQ